MCVLVIVFFRRHPIAPSRTVYCPQPLLNKFCVVLVYYLFQVSGQYQRCCIRFAILRHPSVPEYLRNKNIELVSFLQSIQVYITKVDTAYPSYIFATD